MIDYEILRLIWWLFIGVLLVGFAIMDGQDMGVGSLLPFLGKNDTDRRCMINSVAPHWDGNQVWLLTGGGAIFAAWPLLYGAAFSGFYWAMLIVLLALILRPVGFDFRGKLASTRWRNTWDWLLFVGSAVPPIIFGVAFGNLLQGGAVSLRRVAAPDLHGKLLWAFESLWLAVRRCLFADDRLSWRQLPRAAHRRRVAAQSRFHRLIGRARNGNSFCGGRSVGLFRS